MSSCISMCEKHYAAPRPDLNLVPRSFETRANADFLGQPGDQAVGFGSGDVIRLQHVRKS